MPVRPPTLSREDFAPGSVREFGGRTLGRKQGWGMFRRRETPAPRGPA